MKNLKLFKRVYIEITNACNLSCSFCPTTSRKLEFMEVSDFANIIKKVSPFTDYVYLHVKGEPLLHPDLGEILNICANHSMFVNITTNGTLLKDNMEKLSHATSLRQINVSLHSFEGNNLINFDEYIDGIISTATYFREYTNVITSLRLWNLDSNIYNCNNILKNMHILDKLKEQFELDKNIITMSNIKSGMKLSERIYLNQDYQFIWPSISLPTVGDKGFCYGLKQQLAILVDGTVVPCCLDSDGITNLGNIKNYSLEYILNTPRVKNMLNGFSKKIIVEELCKHCAYRERFCT